MMEKRSPEGKAAKYAYIKQYQKDNYDQLKIEVPKGERERIKGNAKRRSLSMTQYILTAVDEYEDNHPL